MTPLALWAAVALVALVATSMWAILARETGVYVTAGISFTAWSWVAIVGGDVALATPSGPIWVRETTASLQFIALALAVVSLVVIVMRLFGAYPSPESGGDADESRSNRQAAD